MPPEKIELIEIVEVLLFQSIPLKTQKYVKLVESPPVHKLEHISQLCRNVRRQQRTNVLNETLYLLFVVYHVYFQ